MKGCYTGCLFYYLRGYLPVIRLYYNMGACNILYMEPHIGLAGCLMGKLVVLPVVASYKDCKAVDAVLRRGQLYGLFLLSLRRTPYIPLLGKLGAYRVDLCFGLCTVCKVPHAFKVHKLLFIGSYKLCELFPCSLRTPVAAVEKLHILGRSKHLIQLYLYRRQALIIEVLTFKQGVALLYPVQICGEQISHELVLFTFLTSGKFKAAVLKAAESSCTQ